MEEAVALGLQLPQRVQPVEETEQLVSGGLLRVELAESIHSVEEHLNR